MNTAQAVRQEAFGDLELQIIEQNGEGWFSAEDIGKALGMDDPRKSVVQIFRRNRDEFEGLYRVVSLTTWLKSGTKLPYRFTTFNPQGAYLLAILARTPKSKALRRWLAKFMSQDLNRLKDGVAKLQAQHEADQKLIGELEVEVQRQRDRVLSKVSWDDVEEMPVWFWGLNARIKSLEIKLEKPPNPAPAVDPKDLILVPTKYLQKFRDMTAPDHFAKTQRLFHAILQAQGEWEILIRQLDKLGQLAVTGKACIRHDPARFIADKLKLN